MVMKTEPGEISSEPKLYRSIWSTTTLLGSGTICYRLVVLEVTLNYRGQDS